MPPLLPHTTYSAWLLKRPRCPHGHKARYMLDGRRLEAKGGHFIECRCSCTAKHPTFDLAWAHWHKQHALRPVEFPVPEATSNVVQLGLRLTGGTT
ncbi:hypothetical protein [Stenotrophomonas nematodicola]|uniref:hypothetical protein n=1 Tax=Stenotrophomonas nematodicola TaxID=2656746 RepID=UPI003D9A195B